MARVGRHFREFILNLDNCHDYFKLTFTRMRAPSFFVDQEHERGEFPAKSIEMANKLFEFLGLNVIYRSKRRGFTYYVLGQLKEIARSIYGHEELRVEVKRQEIVFDTVVVNFRYNLYDSSGFPRKKHTPDGFFNPAFIVH